MSEHCWANPTAAIDERSFISLVKSLESSREFADLTFGFSRKTNKNTFKFWEAHLSFKVNYALSAVK